MGKFENNYIVGKNPRMFEIYKVIGKAAANKASVLIQGETGTGRELLARAIHFNSILSEGPFVVADCIGLPQDLLDIELFGYEKVAPTRATASRIGKFERASRGTLFLDELGNLSLLSQTKLLRALEEKRIERIGGTRPIRIDVRIIAATHRDLEKAVKEGSFREDLYYRLNVVLINLPPLRERKDDIPLLVEHFIRRYRPESQGKLKYVPLETLDLLMRYNWPGNVRELENVIERAVVMGKGDTIFPQDLPLELQKLSKLSPFDLSSSGTSLKKRVGELEKELITNALKETHWAQTKAAKLLGTSRRVIKYKMEKYGVANN